LQLLFFFHQAVKTIFRIISYLIFEFNVKLTRLVLTNIIQFEAQGGTYYRYDAETG
jgi:hypothetical protein